MDSERLKIPKTKTKNSISLDSRFVDLENSEECATLMWEGLGNFHAHGSVDACTCRR